MFSFKSIIANEVDLLDLKLYWPSQSMLHLLINLSNLKQNNFSNRVENLGNGLAMWHIFLTIDKSVLSYPVDVLLWKIFTMSITSFPHTLSRNIDKELLLFK